MAAEKDKTVTLKALVDKQHNRIVFVESGKEFVDIILSFLTMPLGTIIRLVRTQKQPGEFGCMTNLYSSLECFGSDLLKKDYVKELLLHPKNPAGGLFSKLKINIDDTEPMKYYISSAYLCGFYDFNPKRYSSGLISTSNEYCARGLSTDFEIRLEDKENDDGVFVKGVTFMVTDDLQIKLNGTETIFTYLNDLGIKGVDAHMLEEKTIRIGAEEILGLLRLSSTSLTDVLLSDCGKDKLCSQTSYRKNEVQSSANENAKNVEAKMSIKLFVQKSNNKVLFAEVGEDFLDILFSFFMLPLGLIVNLLDACPELRCFSNLYRSVECLDLSRSFTSTKKALLVSPMVDPHSHSGDKDNLLQSITLQPKYFCKWKIEDSVIYATLSTDSFEGVGEKLTPVDLCVNSSPCGFIKGPATFLITDDLVVSPFSYISCISILQKANIIMSNANVDTRLVYVDRKEAIMLLQAALTSKTALTTAFIDPVIIDMKIPKQEI